MPKFPIARTPCNHPENQCATPLRFDIKHKIIAARIAIAHGYAVALADKQTGQLVSPFIEYIELVPTLNAVLATYPDAFLVTVVPRDFIVLEISPTCANGLEAVHLIQAMYGASDVRMPSTSESSFAGARIWAYVPDEPLPGRNFYASQQLRPAQQEAGHLAQLFQRHGISILMPGSIIALEDVKFSSSLQECFGLPHFDFTAEPRWNLDLSKYEFEADMAYSLGNTPCAFYRFLSDDGKEVALHPEREVEPCLGGLMLLADAVRINKATDPDQLKQNAMRFANCLAKAETRSANAKALRFEMYRARPRQRAAENALHSLAVQTGHDGVSQLVVGAFSRPIQQAQMRWRSARMRKARQPHIPFTEHVQTVIHTPLSESENEEIHRHDG